MSPTKTVRECVYAACRENIRRWQSPTGPLFKSSATFQAQHSFRPSLSQIKKGHQRKGPAPPSHSPVGGWRVGQRKWKVDFFWFRPLPFSSEGKFRLAKSSNRKPLFTESTKSFVFLRILTKTFHILCKSFFCLHLALTCKGFKEKCTFSF